MSDERTLGQIHYEIIRGMIDEGTCPTNVQLSLKLGISEIKIEELLQALSDIHGVVLHSHNHTPWIIHPFSTTPTLNWIDNGQRGWWAPCVWCALGVATLVGGNLRIHSRIGGESESVVIPVHNGLPTLVEDIWVHFAEPPARAWDNVHAHCSMVLPFRSPGAIGEWSKRHALPHGQGVPLAQVALLAQHWYGSHANPEWRKWTITEAQEIFHRSGLTAEFWDLGVLSGKF